MSSKKNPWGDNKNDNSDGDKNPWGNGRGPRGGNGSGGGEPPDLDDVLRKAQDSMRDMFSGKLNIWGAATLGVVIIALLWLASGFYIVYPREHVVVQRFGKWDRTQKDEGWGYHLPAPLEKSTNVTVTSVREMNIGFVSQQTRNGDRKIDLPEESLMLTSDANIIDLDLVVQWNIKSAEDFLFKINDPESTIKKVAESAIREVVGQNEMFAIITRDRQAVADRAKDIMTKNLDDYQSGINIVNVLIQEAEVHPDVQAAFQDVQSAKQDAEDVQNKAKAYSADILPRARGQAIKLQQEAEAYKESVIATAKGDADRFNSIYSAYLKGEDVTKRRLYIETMERVLANAQKTILGTEASGNVVPYLPLDQVRPAAGSNNNGNGLEMPSPNRVRR